MTEETLKRAIDLDRKIREWSNSLDRLKKLRGETLTIGLYATALPFEAKTGHDTGLKPLVIGFMASLEAYYAKSIEDAKMEIAQL